MVLNGSGKSLLMQEIFALTQNSTRLKYKYELNIKRILIKGFPSKCFKNINFLFQGYSKINKENGEIEKTNISSNLIYASYKDEEIWFDFDKKIMYFEQMGSIFSAEHYYENDLKKYFIKSKYIKNENDLKDIRENWINNLIECNINAFWLRQKSSNN